MRGDYGTSQDKLVKTTNGRTLKSRKAPGEDEVCAEMLKAGGEETARHLCQILQIIIQQIVTMPIYGKEALNICHPYMTDILRYT